jgi:hypothetical protein
MSKKSVDFRLKTGTIAGSAPTILPDEPLPPNPDSWVNLEPTESLVPFDPSPAPTILAAMPAHVVGAGATPLAGPASSVSPADDPLAAARVARYAPMMFGFYNFTSALSTMLRGRR